MAKQISHRARTELIEKHWRRFPILFIWDWIAVWVAIASFSGTVEFDCADMSDGPIHRTRISVNRFHWHTET